MTCVEQGIPGTISLCHVGAGSKEKTWEGNCIAVGPCVGLTQDGNGIDRISLPSPNWPAPPGLTPWPRSQPWPLNPIHDTRNPAFLFFFKCQSHKGGRQVRKCQTRIRHQWGAKKILHFFYYVYDINQRWPDHKPWNWSCQGKRNSERVGKEFKKQVAGGAAHKCFFLEKKKNSSETNRLARKA